MNFLKKVYCRIFQMGFRIAMPFLPYRDPKLVNSCGDLADVLKNEKANTVLIVTDAGIVSHGLVKPVLQAIEKAGASYHVFDATKPNPTVNNVESALSLYHEKNCDCLIAIGGGSAIDCAKAVGARVVYPKRSLAQLGGILKVWRKLPLFIAIPTTAGTGSETTVAALITDEAKAHKYALMSFPLISHYAVLDASLTYSLPSHITATTGMDALSHAVEAYIGRSTTRQTRQLALEATALVFENVETAYRCGNDHKARENMLRAAHKAGIAFSKSYVGYIHAIAHSLGGKYGTPHGLANAVLMPYVLDAYGASVYKKLHRLGIAAGVSSAEDSHEAGAKKFITAIKMLNAKMNIPETLEGIVPEDISAMARFAEKEANPLYPVPRLMTREELENFYFRVADWREENDK